MQFRYVSNVIAWDKIKIPLENKEDLTKNCDFFF
jgi:hypothetical protein